MERKVRQFKMTLGGNQTEQPKSLEEPPDTCQTQALQKVFQCILPPAMKYLSTASLPGLRLHEALQMVPQTEQEDKALQEQATAQCLPAQFQQD